MANGDLSLGATDERFSNPLKAAEYLESIRWPNGPVCPHCGEAEKRHYKLKDSKTRRLWKCAACRKQFSVMVGTIFEDSKIPLNKWLYAFYLLCSSKKGMSAHQLHRMLGVTYKSAWFMAHRIRMAMAEPPFQTRLAGIVEVDETYIGGKARNRKKRYQGVQKKTGRGVDKAPVVALVERGGKVRSSHIANVTADELKGAIRQHVNPTARIMTDAYPSYRGLEAEYAADQTVDHWKIYVDGEVHTNTVENFFSILKRGVNGVYHHVSQAHLHRYLSEFDFRYNVRGVTEGERTVMSLGQAEGNRLY